MAQATKKQNYIKLKPSPTWTFTFHLELEVPLVKPLKMVTTPAMTISITQNQAVIEALRGVREEITFMKQGLSKLKSDQKAVSLRLQASYVS
jgi:hypothetical protein